MQPRSPGDLRLSEITGVFLAMQRIRDLALEGHNEATIAQTLEWRREDVREAARLQGFDVSPLTLRHEVCPVCGSLMEGIRCEVCILRHRLERLMVVNIEEHRREVERLEREIDGVKQDTKRCRERQGTNPRMKTHSGWIAWLTENPSKLEEVVLAVQESFDSDGAGTPGAEGGKRPNSPFDSQTTRKVTPYE